MWTWIFASPSTGSAAEQQQILDDLVANGIDGIAVSVDRPGQPDGFLNKIAGQTLLVSATATLRDSKRVAYIGTDNVAAGGRRANDQGSDLPNGGKIMLFVGHSDAQNAKERLQGIKKTLAGSNIQIIDIRTDDTDRPRPEKRRGHAREISRHRLSRRLVELQWPGHPQRR